MPQESPKTDSVPKRREQKVIKKGKGFKIIRIKNTKTGRMNKLYACTTCNKRFSKLCNVKDH